MGLGDYLRNKLNPPPAQMVYHQQLPPPPPQDMRSKVGRSIGGFLVAKGIDQNNPYTKWADPYDIAGQKKKNKGMIPFF